MATAKAKTVLLCGGTGLIGSRLQEMLRSEGYRVKILSRRKAESPDLYYWDPDRQFLNPDALECDFIINLAGAGVADKKWTAKRKQEIIDSRVQSAELIYKKLTEFKRYPKAYISASAIGLYGNHDASVTVNEDSPPGQGFLAETTARWEQAANEFNKLGMRTVLIRIGVVLSPDGGALQKIAQPIKLYAGAPLGSGEQLMSWIHIDDCCRLFLQAVKERDMKGPYNATTPNAVSNAEFTRLTAKVLDKPLILPNVPAFALKMMLGEMAEIVLEGVRVAPERTLETGFTFQFPDLEGALRHLYGRNEESESAPPESSSASPS